MPRHPDSGRIDLREVFRRVQVEMMAQMQVGRMIEHSSSAGNAAERSWLELLHRYLPKKYRAAPAFVIDAEGRRSRQIDMAIFDNFSEPLLFPHTSGLHVPVESVYAVFEVKAVFSRPWVRYAAEKAASVQTLARGSGANWPILAGLLAAGSDWPIRTFPKNLRRALMTVRPALDLGCSLEAGAFEFDTRSGVRISEPEESLVFFILRLIERLRAMGPAPVTDLMRYGSSLKSFR